MFRNRKLWFRLACSLLLVAILVASILIPLSFRVSVGTSGGILSISLGNPAYANPAFTPRTETYVNVSSLTTPFNITVTKPSGTANGDILFCWIGWYAAVTIDSVPSGWALLGQYIVNTDRYALYYKIAASEGASWVWSFTATAKVRAVCSCYTAGDFDSTTPIDVVSNTAYRTSDANCRAATMTVTAVNSPLIFWGGDYSTASKTFTKPSVPTTGWVEDDDAGSTTPDFWTEVCSFIWSGSGATGAMSATISATSQTTKHAFAVALKPPAVPNISVSPTSYNFGILVASSTPSTTTTYFTIDNTSTMQTDQTISVTTATWSGGVTWVHSDTCTPGTNTAGLKTNRGGIWGTGDIIVKYNSPNYIHENCPANTDYSFGLKMWTPTEFTDGIQKQITVRITAVSG